MMKRLFTLLTAVLVTVSFLLLILNTDAQAPQKMSYQAVIRDAGNKLVTNHSVGMRISILQGTVTGTSVYVETQTATSNVIGLVTIEIGTGKTIDKFSSIKWANGPYFIKTETDPSGGTGYSIAGTSELLSVPYALYAEKSGGGHTIGEKYGGGIVFYVYDNGQHGLIASATDQSASAYVQWFGGTNKITSARGNGVGAGLMNTAIIIASVGSSDGGPMATKICVEYSATDGSVSYGDWYLPSRFELSLLYPQKSIVGGFENYIYWSSTEDGSSSDKAWVRDFGSGGEGPVLKKDGGYVRAVRAF